jgi:DNA-binding transcriptional ArsR family regulator
MSELAEVFEIDDADTFEMLTDPMRVELIERLFEPSSVSELAEAMDVPRTRLYHHIRLLEEAKVIRVVRTRQRGAIPEKIYQVAAHNIRPSDRILAEYPPRHAAAAVIGPILSTTRADIIRSATDGRFDFKRSPDEKKFMVARILLSLSPERRHRFITELREVIERYSDEDEPDGEPVAGTILVYTSSRGKR